MRIYLDVCCLCRPFDDHSQDKIRLESEAVLTVIDHGQANNWVLLTSDVTEVEISKIPAADKRQKIQLLFTLLHPVIAVDENIEKRAIELEETGFKPFDALHVACAEKGKADIFLTTDDGLLKKGFQNKGKLKIQVANPVIWLMEVFEKWIYKH